MDSLDGLYREYRHIVNAPGAEQSSLVWRQLRAWVRDDVLPVTHQLAKRSSFRECVNWALDNLLANSKSPERALIEELDRTIVAFAGRLHQSTGLAEPRIGSSEVESDVFTLREVIYMAGARGEMMYRSAPSFDRIDQSLSEVKSIADRFWTDLASGRDFFEPENKWTTTDLNLMQTGDFLVSFNPEIREGGDFISRCLNRRVEILLDVLADAFRLLTVPKTRSSGPMSYQLPPWDELAVTFSALRKQSKLLHYALLEGDQQPLRDACVLLTQIGVATSANFDVTWLASAAGRVETGAATFHRRLFHQENRAIYERIASALVVLRDFYAKQDQSVTAIEEAIAGLGLVVNRTAQEAFWNGKNIQTKWSNYPSEWQLLVRLAEKSRFGYCVGDDDNELFPNPPAKSTLAMRCTRLKKNLPPDLRHRIIPGGQARSYRFDLNKSAIRLF